MPTFHWTLAAIDIRCVGTQRQLLKLYETDYCEKNKSIDGDGSAFAVGGK